MRRVPERSVVIRSLVVAPLAVLLLAGCAEGDSAAGRLNDLNDAAQQLDDGAQQLEDAAQSVPDLSDAEQALEDAAQNLGETGRAKAACTAVRAVVNSSEGDDTAAAATELAATVSTVVARFSESGEGTFDLDAAMGEECPAVHERALEAAGRDSLNELYRN